MEQIHLAGSIRPLGALLLVSEPDLDIRLCSANAAAVLGRTGTLVGQSLDALGGTLAGQVRARIGEPLNEIPAAVRCRIDGLDQDLDGLIHRPPGGGVIIELTDAGPHLDLSEVVCDALRAISTTVSLAVLCDACAQLFKGLLGYDRVMVYRFDERGHGEVFAEQREPHLEAFLHNRYPATDIPQIARRLYVRNRIRVLENVDYQAVPLTSPLSPFTGEPLDMSLCYLRSTSPIHIQYLKNMGVSATLVASLMVGGRLWGLVSCHHYSPRVTPYGLRVACELLAEAMSTRIAALQCFAQAQSEMAVRRLEQRMIEALSRHGDWEHALFENPQFLLDPLGATGAALLCEGRAHTAGEVPSTGRLNAIRDWLDGRPHAPVHATESLGQEAPWFGDLMPEACGLLAVPLSSSPGEYLVWFRPEQVRTLTWGGNPNKAVEVGDDPTHLSPRRSFARWNQVVEGTCEPWTPDTLTAGRLIGESVADVIHQSRSLRVLIAREQLHAISDKVHRSDQPVVIAGADGVIVLTNQAFDRLVSDTLKPRLLGDLLSLFIERDEVGRNLTGLQFERRAWRGEFRIRSASGVARPMMVRGDAVLSTPKDVLGFVVLLTDLSERNAAEDARRRFQVSVVERHRIGEHPVKDALDLRRRKLLASILGNAQLAALEITDGPDLNRVPEMLESIQSSVERTTELLEHLLRYSVPNPGDSDPRS